MNKAAWATFLTLSVLVLAACGSQSPAASFGASPYFYSGSASPTPTTVVPTPAPTTVNPSATSSTLKSSTTPKPTQSKAHATTSSSPKPKTPTPVKSVAPTPGPHLIRGYADPKAGNCYEQASYQGQNYFVYYVSVLDVYGPTSKHVWGMESDGSTYAADSTKSIPGGRQFVFVSYWKVELDAPDYANATVYGQNVIDTVGASHAYTALNYEQGPVVVTKADCHLPF
jgi:hypothetical protein